jgi:PAS domain S-box-containing protein
VLTVDRFGRYTDGNRAALAMLGCDRDWLLARSIPDLVVAEDLQRGLANFGTVSEAGAADGRFRLRRADGGIVDVVQRAVRLSDDCLVAYCFDVSELRGVQQALDTRTEFYTAVVERNPDGFCVLDLQGRLLEVNDAYVRRSGYTRDQLLTMAVGDLEAVATSPDIGQRIEEVVRCGHAFFESFHRTADGTIWPVEVNASHLPAAGGRVLVFMRDVTARRRSEAMLRSRLRLSEYARRATLSELLRAVLDEAELLTASRIGFFHFVERDQQYLELYQWSTNTVEQMCQAVPESHHYSIDVAGVWVDCVHTKRPVVYNDYPSLPHRKGLPDGHAPIARMLSVPVMRDGEVVAIIGVGNKHTDYTGEDADAVSSYATMALELVERIRAEERLREREEQYRLALQAGQIGTFRHDLRQEQASFDDLAARHHGLQTVTPTREEAHARVHPDDRARVAAEFERAMDPLGDGAYEIEHRIVDDDGRVRWISVRAHVEFEGGRPARVSGTSRDISARRLALQAAEQSEARYRGLTETTFDWVWQVDAEGRYVDVSPRVRDLLGYEPDEVIGRFPFDFIAAGEVERVRDMFARAAATRAPFSGLENTNVRKDGRLVVLETAGVPVIGPDGEFLGYRGVDRDVTDRRLAERRLAAQAQIGHLLAESSPLADAIVDVLRVLCETEGWQYGDLWARDPDEPVLRCLAAWHHPGIPGEDLVARSRTLTFGRGEGLPGRTWDTGIVQIVRPEDLPALTRGREAQAAGLSHAITFPLRLRGEVTGVIECSAREPIDLDARRLELLGAVGNDLGLYLERRRAQERLERFVASSPSVLYVLRSIDGDIQATWVSENILQITGFTPDEALAPGWWHSVVHQDDIVKSAVTPGAYPLEQTATFQFRVRRKDGRWVWIRDDRRLLEVEGGRVVEIVGAWSDVTERVGLEDQLRQSQKLEAVGQLAGGIAHDFNNLLTVITGYSEMLMTMIDEKDEALRTPLADIRDAGERAASLTRQLLAFSRKQVLEPRVVDLNASVAHMEKLLRRLIGEDVVLTTVLSPTLRRVLVDPGQVEQVILNLAVNSRDAMPKGGRLTIETRNAVIDDAHCRAHAGARPGAYVRLSVTDTGMGMSPEVKRHIFEPFFTTKAPGRGTGLGLATVFGLVAQSDGWIEVESAPGAGARFDVFLPVASGEHVEQPGGGGRAVAGGRETILVVEDEAGVRNVARRALELQGYRVLEADSLDAAIHIFAEDADRIGLVVTDLVMPGGSGRELAERLRAAEPRLKVLFMSGYTDDAVIRHGISQLGEAFLQKPFSPLALAQKVREMLDAPGRG